ncbi:TonB-dependent receptor [Burkholderiaceae bacterium DAT-1]|nr:TonB-dependent receptor [Burkholderiaceae bacterium DAT-1]
MQSSSTKQPRPFQLRPLALLIAGLGLTIPLSALAADAPAKDGAQEQDKDSNLSAVVVRGQKLIERDKDVPASESIVSGQELAQLQAYTLNAIVQRAANIAWNQGNQRTSSLSIRGIGKIGQTEAQDPSVGVTIDGVSLAYNPLTSSVDFTDVANVEVARGPQGFNQGKNANLGSVIVTTNRPSFKPDGDYSITFGQRSTVIGTVAGGGPVIDELLAWRGSLAVSRGLGDFQNALNRYDTYTNTDRISARTQFLLTPSPEFNARLELELKPAAGENTNNRSINQPTPATYSNGTATNLGTDASTRLARSWFTSRIPGYSYSGNYLNGGDTLYYNAQFPLTTGTKGATLELNWDLGNSRSVTSITALKSYFFNAVNDDGTPFDIYSNAGGYLNNYKQASQEIRLSSFESPLVDYTTGLYFLRANLDAKYQRSWGSDAGAWFASTAQYNTLSANAPGQLLLQQSLEGVSMAYNSPSGLQEIRNQSAAAFGEANWHFTPAFTLTTGVRFTHEYRRQTGSSYLENQGIGAVLNPVSVNGVQLGGFASAADGTLLPGNGVAQLSKADQVALQYFGVSTTAVAGAAYNSLSAKQKAQVAAAKAIRAANIGVLFAPRQAETYEATLPSFELSPSYKLSNEQTIYASLRHGEKAGIAQLVNGVSAQVKPEKVNTFEVGLKSSLLDHTLSLNADVYAEDIRDYQQAVRVVDQYTTTLNNNGQFSYTTATGNVPRVQVRGIEFDGAYSGLKYWTFRFAGAYNRATYKEFTNNAQPVENGYAGASPYRDVSGQTLPGAPKLTFNIAPQFRIPAFRGLDFHVEGNIAYTGRFNADAALSSYAEIPATTLVDLSFGLGRSDRRFDASIVIKNAFNNDTPLSKTWNSVTPATPRWAGIVFTGKF